MDPEFTPKSPPDNGGNTDRETDPVADDPRHMEFRLTADRRRILVPVPLKPHCEELP